MRRELFPLLLCGLLWTGCGVKVQRSPELDSANLLTVAIIPPVFESELPRERQELLYSLIENEMRSSGFIVLDRAAVTRVCGSDKCAQPGKLFQKYPVDAIARLTVDSSVQANILIGSYRSLGGMLELSPKSGPALVSVKGSESERGGLLFNTGQIFEGLKTTADGSDSVFQKLARRFVQKLVVALPRPKSSAAATSFQPNIVMIQREPREGVTDNVCLTGDPGLLASIRNGRRVVGLREVQPGKYCNFVLRSVLDQSKAQWVAELRSLYGALATREIPNPMPCEVGRQVKREDGIAASTLSFLCKAEPGCRCRQAQFLIFTADRREGPYRYRTTVSGNEWDDPQQSPVYVVIEQGKFNQTEKPLVIVRGETNVRP